MSKSMINIVMLCFASSILAGCGTKGPLYIPEQRYPQSSDTKATPNNPSETSAPSEDIKEK